MIMRGVLARGILVVNDNVKEQISDDLTLDLALAPKELLPVLEHSLRESKFRTAFGFAGFLFLFPTSDKKPILGIDTVALKIAAFALLVCAIAAFIRYLRISTLVHEGLLIQSLDKISSGENFYFIQAIRDKKDPIYKSHNKWLAKYSGGEPTLLFLDMIVVLSITAVGLVLLFAVLVSTLHLPPKA